MMPSVKIDSHIIIIIHRRVSFQGKGRVKAGDGVIIGELDQATPPSDAKLMAENIPGASLAVIPGAARLANLE
jgi:pimeloyl-ACP methyl ester carboxylesterase